MPKTKISEFSATPGNNTDIDGINIAEGCAPSGINDAIRELMAQLKDFQAGTAGDSFNGPVGTSTAAAGAFTTLTTSSTVTHNGGTANGVAYLNGSKVLTTGSALTFDGTNLTVPAEVYRTSASSYLRLAGGDAAAAGAFVLAFGQSHATAPGRLSLGTSGTGTMNFDINGSEQARLTSTGLGIGTSSPLQQLHLSSASATGMQITYQGVGAARIGVAAGNLLNFGLDTSNGTTTRMTLDSSGNLGIGTSSPGYRLTAAGASTAGSVTALAIENPSTNAASEVRQEWRAGGSSWSYITTSYNSNSPYMAFGVSAASSAPTERMRLDASGNLGLGVTPSVWASNYRVLQMRESYAALASDNGNGVAELTSNAYNDGSWRYANSSVGAVRYQANAVNRTHAWYTAPSGTAGNAISFTQAMTLDASGNLQVGTTTSGGAYATFGNSSASGANRWAAVFGTNSASAGNPSSFGLTVGWNYSSGGGENNIIYGTSAGSTPGLAFSSYNGTTITERARITSGGDLLVGKTATDGSVVGVQLLPSGASAFTRSGSTNATSTLDVYSTGAGAYRFYVGMDGTVNATNTTISAISDQRLKENIRDLDVGLNAIMTLKPRKFDWKEGKGKNIKGDRGWIAQEFEQVFPDMIDTWKDEAPEGEEPYKSVRADLIPVLVKAIQELKAEFDAYKATHP